VTAGSADRTCRWWKVEEEVQLVLRGGGRSRTHPDTPGSTAPGAEFVENSIDVVCMLDDSHFVSGGNSGSISLWSTGKKKPIFTVQFAHGLDGEGYNPLLESSQAKPQPRWITSLAAIRGTNVFASGSWDGAIRLWVLDEQLRNFKPAGTLPLAGFVNKISILAKGEGNEATLTAAVGREPRLGRWFAVKGVPNGLFVADLVLDKDQAMDESA